MKLTHTHTGRVIRANLSTDVPDQIRNLSYEIFLAAMRTEVHIAHCTKSIVAVKLQCVYLLCIIKIFQHNTPRLIYFKGLET